MFEFLLGKIRRGVNNGERTKYEKLPTASDEHAKNTSKEGHIENDLLEDDDHSNHKISSTNAFWNVCNSIQGVAILAMPYVIKGGGWWSLVAMVIVAAISNYTGQILIKCHYEEVHEDSDSIVYLRTR